MSEAEWLTTREVADAGGVTIGRVRQLCIEGRFPNARRVGPVLRGLWLIPAEDVDRWLTHGRDLRLKGAGEKWMRARRGE